MNKLNFLSYLSLIAIVFTALACNKGNDPNPEITENFMKFSVEGEDYMYPFDEGFQLETWCFVDRSNPSDTTCQIKYLGFSNSSKFYHVFFRKQNGLLTGWFNLMGTEIPEELSMYSSNYLSDFSIIEQSTSLEIIQAADEKIKGIPFQNSCNMGYSPTPIQESDYPDGINCKSRIAYTQKFIDGDGGEFWDTIKKLEFIGEMSVVKNGGTESAEIVQMKLHAYYDEKLE